MDHSDESIQADALDTNAFLLPGGPFATSNFVIRFLYKASVVCFVPWISALDTLLSMFIKTTDRDRVPRNIFLFCIQAFFLFLSLICTSPLALLAFLIWCPLQFIRPRAYSYICPDELVLGGNEKYRRIGGAGQTGDDSTSCKSAGTLTGPNTYSVITSNLCLMPEFIAHINNLHSSRERGKMIAKLFCGETIPNAKRAQQSHGAGGSKQVEAELLFSPWSSETFNFTAQSLDDDSATDAQSITSTLWSVTSKERAISTTFPPTDFLCLQEVFHRPGTGHLIRGLRTKYPYIIHDVSLPIHDRFLSPLSSGLCIASKYPFVDITFKAFPYGSRDDKLACKGLLMTKVYLGPGDAGEDKVGYLATTHLQAWPRSDSSDVRCKQLQCISDWMEDFVAKSKMKSSKEAVLFSVITGDFNFDKVSYFDVREQKCEFFSQYLDPCMDESNQKQHSWVVGTELQQHMMHDDSVRTPQGLQRMMVSELERHQYVASTTPIKSSLQRVGDGKRRIDYVLYKQCEQYDLAVKDYKFFTCLATLTDHIPVGMMFTCEKRTA